MEWKAIKGSGVTGYELIMSSLADDSDEKRFDLSNKDHSKKLDVQSSNLYEIQIRAKNSLGHSRWTKLQQEAKAGTNEIVRKKSYFISLCGFLSRSLSYLSCLLCNNYSIIAQVRILYVAYYYMDLE